MIVDALSHSFTYTVDPGKVRDTGARDFASAAKGLQQAFSAFWPQPIDFVQYGLPARLAATVTVRGDGKPVCLIPDLLDQMQPRRACRQYKRCGGVGQKELFQARFSSRSLGNAE